MRENLLPHGPLAQGKGDTMFVFFYLDASQPSGATYCLGLGCFVHPKLASMVVLLIRLF